MFRFLRCLAACLAVSFLSDGAWLSDSWAQTRTGQKSRAAKARSNATVNYEAEARLIEVYRLIGAGKSREALGLSSQLVADFPHFQLAQLIHGDLLSLQTKPIKTFGDIPATMNKNGTVAALTELREESVQRFRALRDRPQAGTVPSQLLGLSTRNKHVIAVDASKSRLYLLSNSPQGLHLVADFYISVGKSGISKYLEGDLKTPLGIYYLTTPIDPKLLAPLYGGGALPINYPNPFDLRLGKTGSGIWLHGSPPERYSRQPKSTDGCIVLANPDLQKLMATVAIKTTPVIIASQLQWLTPVQLQPERRQFEASLDAWRAAKNNGQAELLYSFYAADFNNYGRTLKDWWPSVAQSLKMAHRRPFQWHEVAVLLWRTEPGSKNPNVMVVTYDEYSPGIKQPTTKRQYWVQAGNQWKIFFEGAIATS